MHARDMLLTAKSDCHHWVHRLLQRPTLPRELAPAAESIPHDPCLAAAVPPCILIWMSTRLTRSSTRYPGRTAQMQPNMKLPLTDLVYIVRDMSSDLVINLVQKVRLVKDELNDRAAHIISSKRVCTNTLRLLFHSAPDRLKAAAKHGGRTTRRLFYNPWWAHIGWLFLPSQ
jgi:hypothetical protein